MTYTVVASGLTPTYEDISDMVEALVHTEGRRYPIPGMEQDDIAQEIRMECFRVLEFYDTSRIGPSPFKYLQTCVRNLLYNMRRGIWVPNNPPCARCPLWDRLNKRCMIDEVDCEKIVQYRRNMAIKADLRAPSSLEVDIFSEGGGSECDAILLEQSIRQTLPESLLIHYENLIEGVVIPPRFKRQIREIVLEIIKDA